MNLSQLAATANMILEFGSKLAAERTVTVVCLDELGRKVHAKVIGMSVSKEAGNVVIDVSLPPLTVQDILRLHEGKNGPVSD